MTAQNLSQMRCAVSSRVWISALCVHAQRTVCTTSLSKSTASLVSCLVSCMHVVRVLVPLVVCDEAVVRRTLGLIALVVIVFVVAIFS